MKEMLELRAPEKRRTGIEIKPKVKYPDQTEAAIGYLPFVSDSAIGIWPLERIGSSLPVSFLSIEGLNAKCQWPGAVLLAEC